MKYSGTDFKMTSQANHLGKLLSLLEETQRQSLHMQRLYGRRKSDSEGNIKSNWSVFRENSVINGKSGAIPEEDNGSDIIIFEGGLV